MRSARPALRTFQLSACLTPCRLACLLDWRTLTTTVTKRQASFDTHPISNTLPNSLTNNQPDNQTDRQPVRQPSLLLLSLVAYITNCNLLSLLQLKRTCRFFTFCRSFLLTTGVGRLIFLLRDGDTKAKQASLPLLLEKDKFPL